MPLELKQGLINNANLFASLSGLLIGTIYHRSEAFADGSLGTKFPASCTSTQLCSGYSRTSVSSPIQLGTLSHKMDIGGTLLLSCTTNVW